MKKEKKAIEKKIGTNKFADNWDHVIDESLMPTENDTLALMNVSDISMYLSHMKEIDYSC